MCGIGGFLQAGGVAAEAARADLSAMAASLVHRGPDAGGVWLDPQSGIAFCHRRLSIVDLSPLGAQPMRSRSGRFTITFNGEIYNFRALRDELSAQGHTFRGGSDTEVLLAAVERWGVKAAVERCRGMFAFALWDQTERELWLARDRFGEKPLYYGTFRGKSGWANPTFLFGSELKALRAHRVWGAEVDRNALALLLKYGYVPAPHTIFSGVRKLRPGCILRAAIRGGEVHVEERAYWQPSAPVGDGSPSELGAVKTPSAEEALERVNSALEESIRLQMVADVPVGAFLSGGIDSSLIVALMQRASPNPVRTFSIGFHEEEFNEAPFAKRIAEHLGTRHTELVVTSQDALEVIPRLPHIYDEPFADSSQIPTFLVSRLARRDVTVSLSGDAGDELFGGYSRYLEVRDRWNRLAGSPATLRRSAAHALSNAPPWAARVVAGPMALVSRLRGKQQVSERIIERAGLWGAESLPELYAAMTSFWPPGVVIGSTDQTQRGGAERGVNGTDAIAQMMYADTRSYLPDDILVKVDRAAMAESLETRVPLLDPNVAAAAWSIPTSVHLKDGRGKWILRTLLERHVPKPLFDRPKSGFAVPVARWLRHELKDWAAALIDPARLRQEGYFSPEPIERRWRQHLDGAMNWSAHLWSVLMFQSWFEALSRTSSSSIRVSNPVVIDSTVNMRRTRVAPQAPI
jgi:asparagine synthase (glutamine-hydrolysing)